MHDALNFFDPNRDIPAHHENQLTRAFLVVLRISPAAHQVWLSLAAPNHKLYELPRPRFDTQRWQMFDSMPAVAEPIEGISVLQLADPTDAGDKQVEKTDRRQVLDGLVRYGDELLIVIETKLDGPVAKQQAQELNVHGAPVRFDGGFREVSWRDLLAGWSDLIESEIVAGAERALIMDFLDFVERHFPRLGPFTKLAKCKDNAFRVNRRLNAILAEIAGVPADHWLELPSRATVDRAYLEFEESSQQIRLVVYPADTLTQAKAFYLRPGAAPGVMSLRDRDWTVEPSFHFGYMAKGLVRTKADAALEEYVAYWREQIAGARALPREKWEGFWGELVERGFAKADQKALFDQHFTNTGRESAVPRPGVKCFYSWKLSEAVRLDEGRRLVAAVAEKLNDVLRALGESPHEIPKSKLGK
jgi:hypothetical protein